MAVWEFKQGQFGHVVWTWVDSTDFATVESALVQPTKTILYGMRHGSSDTASLLVSGTSGLDHSAVTLRSGVMQLTIAPSDMSAAAGSAFYDTYLFHASLAGAALVVLPIRGIWTGTSEISNLLSNLSALVSDVDSQVLLNASVISDIDSQLTITASKVLLVQSQLSDVDSQLLLNASVISDIDSQLVITASQVLLTLSNVSDVQSQLDLNASVISDIQSQVDLNASVISDAHSAAILAASHASDAFSVALINRSLISDVDSAVSSQFTALSNQISAFQSDVKSEFDNITTTLGASDISDIASRVWSEKYNVFSAVASSFGSFVVQQTQGASNLLSNISGLTSDAHSAAILAASHASDAASQALLASSRASDAHSAALINQSLISDVQSAIDSQFLVYQSDISDIKSELSDTHSDLRSVISGITASVGASDISDIASAVWAAAVATHGAGAGEFGSLVRNTKSLASDIDSALTSQHSDVISKLSDLLSVASDAHSAAILAASHASDAFSVAVINRSLISDVDSALSSQFAALSNQISAFQSDVKSEFDNIATTVSASDISDIASAVWSEKYNVHSAVSSSFGSFVVQQTQGASNLLSNISGLTSDAHSAAILAASHASDAQSQALIASSRASDAHSMAVANSDAISNVISILTAMGGPEHIASLVWDADKGSYIDASSMGSVLQAGTATPSATADKVWSDFESKVGASISNVVSFLSTVTSDAHSAAILAASHASNAQSMAAGNSDAISNVLSMLTAMGGPEHIASLVWDADKGSYIDASSMGSVLQAVTTTPSAVADKVWSDFESKVGASVSNVVSFLSTVTSDAHSAAILAASHASDAHSMAVANSAAISDLQSDMTSQFAGLSANISDIESQIDAGVSISAGGITSASFTAGALDAAALATDAAEEIADEVLDRNLAGGGSGGTRNVRNALRSLRNRQQIAASVLRVFEENDTTTAWSATISTTSGDPLVEIDP